MLTVTRIESEIVSSLSTFTPFRSGPGELSLTPFSYPCLSVAQNAMTDLAIVAIHDAEFKAAVAVRLLDNSKIALATDEHPST
jgi:hypothetical protein